MADLVACICEGSAEKAIIDLLLDRDLIVFNRHDMLEGDYITTRSARIFQSRYLNREYGDRLIKVVRLLDSENDEFNIQQPYQSKISYVSNHYTKPEIEILVIIAFEKYEEYSNKYGNQLKASEYCRNILGLRQVKSYDFVTNLFSNTDLLLRTLRSYNTYKKFNGLKSIYHLLKESRHGE